ncbi:Glycosyl transferase, family 14 [Artemisia annua]|uniref:Glycosyl transferase, family 14 n=1 Tax=Artemisia annua TaxID=35608 RepID=A0A2U1P751_ARTAN|nr:Glycosyl transferase, family 14 [Artemisia annua]
MQRCASIFGEVTWNNISASQKERDKLALYVQGVKVFWAAQNVNVVGKSDVVSSKGSSVVSAVLHGAAILLKLCEDWDWFVNLNANDYPLVTQDDPHLFPHRIQYHNHQLLFNNKTDPSPPIISYLISGSKNDSGRIIRLLLAVYHPRNQYLLHLDQSASQKERDKLALYVQGVKVFWAAQNVNVVGKSDVVSSKGSSVVSAVLHGAAILLKLCEDWDWFVNLNANDYPLVTQDDLLHILSYMPKDLNFVNHTSYIGWKESRILKPVVVDPGLFLTEQSEIFYGTQRRPLPDAYRSPTSILSRKFVEYCILGTENLPRTLLMYLSNSLSSDSVYFPTVLCNSPQLNRTVVNHNLQYSAYETKHEPRLLHSDDFNDLINSGSAFASPFLPDDPILDRIDQELLNRGQGKPVAGGWCLGGETRGDACSVWGDADVLKPGSGAKRLEQRMVELLSNETFISHQCIFE